MADPSRPATGYPAPPYYQPNGGQAPPSGTAYSYAAPPPYSQQHYNPNPNPYSPRSTFTRSFVRSFCATIICLFVIFGTIALITWLVLRPTLPRFRVESLSVSNFSANAESVSGMWEAGFRVRNDNKKLTVTYRVLELSLFYNSKFIATTDVPPFSQDTKTETSMNATFSAANAYVEKKFVDDMNGDKARGSIPFDVQVLANTMFRSGAWRLRTRVLKVLCRKVPVAISSNSTSGRLSQGPHDCQVWA